MVLYVIKMDLSEKSDPIFIPVEQVIFVFEIDVTEHATPEIKTRRSLEISIGKLTPSIVTKVPPLDEPLN